MEPEKEYNTICVEIPSEGIDDRKLHRFVEKNGMLIARAFGQEELSIERGEDGNYKFPWILEESGDEIVQAEIVFIAKMLSYLRSANRVSSVVKPIKNERYAFRSLLNRIKMSGPGYKNERKLLMRRLTGDAAYVGGRPKKGDKE